MTDEFLIKKRDFVLGAIAFSRATQLLANLTGQDRNLLEQEILFRSRADMAKLDENGINGIIKAYFIGQQNGNSITEVEIKFKSA